MRISDWSSDVCSSDLETEADQPALAGENLHRQLTAIFASHRPLHALDDRRAQAAIILELLGAVLNGDPRFPADELVVGEIGRASCRERVCQYGVDLGGRRLIKKKKNMN